MSLLWKSGLVVLAAIGLMTVGAVGMNFLTGLAEAQPGKAPGKATPASAVYPRYTVVETEGVHLIVTDNQANVVYFYTIDEGEKPGADLHLRGTADLTQVGKPVIKPTLINPRKKRG